MTPRNLLGLLSVAVLSFALSAALAGNEITGFDVDGLAVGTDVQAFHQNLSDLAAITTAADGELLCFVGGGLINLGAGTSTHVLTSNGAGTIPTFQAAAGGNEDFAATLALGNTTDGTDIQLSAGDDLLGTTTSEFSNPGVGASSERFGSLAASTGFGGVAIGVQATANAQSMIAIGYQSGGAAGQDTICIGYLANAGSNTIGSINIGTNSDMGANCRDNIAIGDSATINLGADGVVCIGDASQSASFRSVVIGANSTANTGNDIIAIGYDLDPVTAGQCVIGNGNTDMTDFILGAEEKTSQHADITLRTTPSSGTDIGAGDFAIQPGTPTGNATVTHVRIETPAVGGSGSTLQTMVERLRVDEAGIDVGTEEILAGSAIGTNTVGLKRNADDNWEATDASTGMVATVSSMTGAVFYLSATASEAPTSDTPQAVNSGTSVFTFSNGFDHNAGGFNNSVTYTQAKTRRFTIHVDISAQTGAGSRQSQWTIAVNGSVETGSEVIRDHSTTDVGSVHLSWSVSLDQNDRVEVYVDSAASSPTITVDRMKFIIQAADGS